MFVGSDRSRGRSVLEWNGVEPDRIMSALGRARVGDPTVLIVEGDAGLGKTALLAELVSQASDFQVLRADGLENDRTPFALLAQWGIDPPRPSDGGESSARVAAQALGDRLDSVANAGPVLLLADDLHWADAESVEALLWLLRRTSGHRLLVAVGTRPLPPEVHPGWQRWIAGRASVVWFMLAELTPGQVAALARRRWPALSEDLARRLHEHTGGNPLYLTTVLAENDEAELSTAGVLPAPAAFARSIAIRMARLSVGAQRFLRALCVLGSGWTPLALVGSVADMGESAVLAQQLAESGLVEFRRVAGPVQLRPSHALVRASVYQQTPLPDVRTLHARASTLVASRSVALQHRMAAAEQYDNELADEIEAYAGELYGQRSFRQAAQYLRSASGLTSGPAVRERRWLESVFNLVLSRDYAAVDAELADVGAADNAIGRALVLGAYAVWTRRYRDGVEQLEPLTSTPISTTDTGARYRAEVLLSWARLCLGQPTGVIADGLARAESVRTVDAGLSGLELVASSQVLIRQHGIGPVLGQLSALPVASAVPLAATGALAFRGTLRATMGLTGEAAEDLTEATRRIVDGVTDLGAGSFHAQLGFVQWLVGDWGRSRVSFRQAFDISAPAVHQMTAALAPLVDIGLGRFDDADAMIRSARELLLESPMQEACRTFLGTLLARVHAGGSADDQASALTALRGTPFEVADATSLSPTVLLNYAPALIWAKRLDEAEAAATRLAAMEPTAAWAAAVASWFRGLVAEARGDGPGALSRLKTALAGDLELPLYRAHLLADHARLARLLGRAEADRSLAQAEAIYSQLGAVPYLSRVQAIRSTPTGPMRPAATTAGSLPGGVTLTEREQDVLTLLVNGMSYAQISRELFITQSTVGYHLGNIYGKAGVSSRHALSDLARYNPRLFGISVPTL